MHAATRSDLEGLTALNEAYISSVQHGDVGRFDEILAVAAHVTR
jgi:hypothetical protein